MKIKNITIKNFRLLDGIEVNLENDITLIIGKNNTGKTSFFEAIKLATSADGKFSFEDFSQTTYLLFKRVALKYLETQKTNITEEEKDRIELEIIKTIPKIQVIIEFEYVKATDTLVELSEFITDLEDSRNDASVLISFEPKNSLGLFQSYFNRKDKQVKLISYLQDNINSFYSLRCYALDKKSNYKKEIEDSFRQKIERVVSFEDIKAMRVLDDSKGDRNNTLALGFSKYYNERDKTDDDVLSLEKTLKNVSVDLKEKYNDVLKKILADLKRFGASTPITVPDITIDSEFDSEAVIKRNIKYYYKQDVIDLPESYNGLGYSNLIYMILELASFVEKFKNSNEEKFSNFLVVLIEEPEAHMHPQMQQVFISQITEVIKEAKKESVNIQLVITSHSSHILSEAGIDLDKGFNRVRYFNKINSAIEAQDFNNLEISNDKHTFRFLKQYLTLHKSDLFFADKVILIEGTTERMLLPQMIKKAARKLCNEYVSVLEVGGAYAHKFKEILDFINVKTLIITDIDSVDKQTGKACPVNDGGNGELSSNATLYNWLPKKNTIAELLACVESDKIENNIRVAYQTSENDFNGRSFEDAFVNTNHALLSSSKVDEELTPPKTVAIKNQFSFYSNKAEVKKESVPTDSKAKTNFAFDIMSFNEEKFGVWHVPAYIKEGLEWLAKKE